MMQLLVSSLLPILFAAGTLGSYVPDPHPRAFKVGQELTADVSSLTSHSSMSPPREYYSIKVCEPEEGIQRSMSALNAGAVLTTYNSPYKFHIMKEEFLKSACHNGSAGPLTKEDASTFKQLIDSRARVQMMLDNLPVTVYNLKAEPTHAPLGFPLGARDGNEYVVFNHLVFNVLVHKTHGGYSQQPVLGSETKLVLDASDQRVLAWPEGTPAEVVRALKQRSLLEDKSAKDLNKEGEELDKDEVWMVVGFEIMPCSVARKPNATHKRVVCMPWSEDSSVRARQPPPQFVQQGEDIVYTYDVYWEESEIEWASRWDAYLKMAEGEAGELEQQGGATTQSKSER